MHPIVYHISRNEGRDDVLPLSEPITTNSGKVISEVPIPKGTNLTLSFAAYNRYPKSLVCHNTHPHAFLETKRYGEMMPTTSGRNVGLRPRRDTEHP